MSALHVIVRSCAAENRKSRPEWYSKDLALASVLTAVGVARATGPVDLTYANDGPLPAHRLAVMRRTGRVLALQAGSNRPSLRATVAWAARQPWTDEDLVYLVEDDYLLDPRALVALQEAVGQLAWADWFALHGTSVFGDPTGTSTLPAARRVAGVLAPPGESWREVVSTTSTLAGRMRVLRQDRRILRWAPFTGGAFDEVTTLVLAGHEPFSWSEAASGRAVPGQSYERDPPLVGAARRLARIWANVRSHRRPASRRRFAGPLTPLAVHLELEALDGDPRWSRLAAATPSLAEAERLLG